MSSVHIVPWVGSPKSDNAYVGKAGELGLHH